jgi:aspartyl-tRNA(Asn)/glutamyl-tRNA(Gln) amidotransferase subunit B
MRYEVVIGLETHAELLTESKLWCGCSTRFGQPPNTQTCPVCLGMPGVLPVLNRRAFELAVKAALALNCKVNRTTFFDRKNYYYPDLPKNYQVSQNYRTLGEDGFLDIEVAGQARRVGIWNVHLEEDAGKSIHAEHPGADYSLIDLNRAGVPLLEIVSGPDMRSVEEAEAFMHAVRQVLLYCQVSDCKMEEGSLRFEASISLRRPGTEALGSRVEIKNLNSMKAVSRCLAYEVARQGRILDEGAAVDRETRLWDEAHERSERMRSKELAHDYRYFPEPDLVPFVMAEDWLERLRAEVPELPLGRRGRFMKQYGLSAYEAQVLTDDRALADYFEACAAAHDSPSSVANWIMNDILAILNERRIGIAQFEVPPEGLAELVRLADARKVTAQAAREILARMIETRKDAATLVREMGAETISEAGDLAPAVDQAFAEAPQAVRDYLKGKKQALGALVGQVMRLTRGKADPRIVQELVQNKLDQMQKGP